MNGERETGVTTFMLNEKIDTGKILLAEKVLIGNEETAGELHDRLMLIGSKLVIKTVLKIISGDVNEISQESMISDPVALKPAPKIFREDCHINWDQEVETIFNLIRGLSPGPGAFTDVLLADGTTQNLKIFQSKYEVAAYRGAPGDIFTDGKTFLKIGAKNGFIHPARLQLSGRKVMNSGDFLRGFGKIFPETRAI
jgi:methionyl-tRNA formyltransferase